MNADGGETVHYKVIQVYTVLELVLPAAPVQADASAHAALSCLLKKATDRSLFRSMLLTYRERTGIRKKYLCTYYTGTQKYVQE